MMINKNKTQPVIMALTMILSVAGCSNNQADIPAESVLSDAVSEKENTNASNELNFMNSKVAFPFKLKELKNIKIDEEICFETDDNCLFSQLWYGDYRLGTVILEDCSVDEKNKKDKNVVYLKISPDTMFDDFEFEYMGLTFDSTKEDIINTLGESSDENQLTYMIDEKTKISFKLSDDTICRATISAYDFEDE